LRHRFNVSDLNAIETRVGAWVAGCTSLLDVFTTFICTEHIEATKRERGQLCFVCGNPLKVKDPYLEFATKMYQIPYHNLAKDYESKDPDIKAAAKDKRQIGKPGVLGAIYRLSGGEMGVDRKTGDPKKTGLWGYAENMGVTMSQKEANDAVRTFRTSYPEIVTMWYALEKLAISVLTGEPIYIREGDDKLRFALDRLRELNIWMDKFPVDDHGNERIIFRIHLPSGRFLHYIDAYVDEIKMPWADADGEEVFKACMIYAGTNQETHQWTLGITTHGGKLFENIVQAISRDILAESLLIFEEIGLPVVGHVHDEGITEVEDDPFMPGVREMEFVMSQPIEWAPGLPLHAEGFEDYYYHK
jgi:Casjensviridae DNA polymerase